MRRALVTLLASVSLVLVAAQSMPGPTTFVEHFDGAPAAPDPVRPAGWDTTILARDDDSMIPMMADHGADCSFPDAQHLINQRNQAVFQCKNHIMTAIWNGYGAVYLTPPALMDFSQGPSTLSWEMSTRRTGSRDWIDVVIMPLDLDHDPPAKINFQDGLRPRDAVHLGLGGDEGGSSVFVPFVIRDGAQERLAYKWFGMEFSDILKRAGLEPSASRRDHFKITLSRTHVRVEMPDFPGAVWVDSDISPPLDWSYGLVQLNQRSYNVEKSCSSVEDPNPPYNGVVHNPDGDANCPPNTWHWDEVAINPSAPLSIIPGHLRRVVSQDRVHFAAPAPDGAAISAVGSPGAEYSLDGSAWRPIGMVGPRVAPEHGQSYWQPVPAGTEDVWFRGAVQDMYLYARASGGVPVVQPTAVPTSTPLSTPTSTAVSTATSTATPVPTDTPTPEATATPEPAVEPTATPVPPTCFLRAVVNDVDTLLPCTDFK